MTDSLTRLSVALTILALVLSGCAGGLPGRSDSTAADDSATGSDGAVIEKLGDGDGQSSSDSNSATIETSRGTGDNSSSGDDDSTKTSENQGSASRAGSAIDATDWQNFTLPPDSCSYGGWVNQDPIEVESGRSPTDLTAGVTAVELVGYADFDGDGRTDAAILASCYNPITDAAKRIVPLILNQDGGLEVLGEPLGPTNQQADGFLDTDIARAVVDNGQIMVAERFVQPVFTSNVTGTAVTEWSFSSGGWVPRSIESPLCDAHGPTVLSGTSDRFEIAICVTGSGPTGAVYVGREMESGSSITLPACMSQMYWQAVNGGHFYWISAQNSETRLLVQDPNGDELVNEVVQLSTPWTYPDSVDGC